METSVDTPKESGVKLFKYLGRYTAIGWALFQIYTAIFGFFHGMIQLPVHLAFALAICFCRFPFAKKIPKKKTYVLDLILYFLSFSIPVYIMINFERVLARMTFVDVVTSSDLFFGVILVVLLLEGCRRVAGIPLVIVAVVFIAYGFLGPLIPGGLNHRGILFFRFIDLQLLSFDGIFGTALMVSSDVVFYFILFGAFLETSGGGRLFIDFAFMVTGRLRGGAAKASVISSALFGTVSGSAVANVVVDGIFTIPLMKKTGFKAEVASGVEAATSTGGQIMPPVMGAAAFIMAQILGVPYADIVLAAAIPAILYYVALYFMIDFMALRDGIKAIPKEDIPDVKKGFKERAHLLIPLVVVVWAIMAGYTIYTSALWAIGTIVITSFFRKATRMNIKGILKAMESGAKEAVGIAIPCAVAGIIVGVVVHTGLGLKFTGLVSILAKDSLPLILFLTMIAVLILGMGMPTTPAYLIAVVLVVPAVINLGITPLAIHMFIFYFAVISMITPPVALAAYAAAAIGEANMWLSGLQAFRLAFSGFIIPYIFVYDNSLLFQGSILEIIWAAGKTGLGVYCLSAALIGYFRTPTTFWERIALGIAALCLIVPEQISDYVGFALLIFVFIVQRRRIARGLLAVQKN
jgi:TRAP transporter 4TM/12TM fusion protein